MNTELSKLLADVKDQVLYLQELGLESLDADLPDIAPAEVKSRAADSRPPAADGVYAVSQKAPAETQPGGSSKPGSRLSQMPSLVKRTPGPSNSPSFHPVNRTEPAESMQIAEKQEETLFGDITQTLPEAGESVEDIRAEIGVCTRCPLWEGRTNIVHSTGNMQADLMFVGEAPGADEDIQGFPFVGRAGQLLTKIIEAIGISRDEVFIGNINRCRPPGNRQPTPVESETCKPYLMREIAVVRPKVVVVLGNTATQNLLNTKVGISKLRGNFHDYFGVKVMPTFHPAYLLRDPHKKREVWEDMKKVREYLNSH
jgi:uracil-DNA glycosylase family 4